MLHQKRSGSLARLKYLVAVPICAGLLCASTLAFSKSYGWVDIAPHRIDKSNKSPQVKEPHKRLLVTQNGVSVISDKFSEKNPDGSVRYYTAYNLSNKDKVDFAKKGIQVNVLSDIMIETLEKKSTKINAVAYGHTKTGNKYKVIWVTDKNKNLFSVIVYDKNSSRILRTEHGSTAEEIASLGRKYDFKFESLVNNLNDTAKSIPPPPAPPVKAADRRPPPPPAPPKKLTMVRLLPPPPPFDPAFKDLFEYLGKHVRYPARAFESQETGNVVIQFNLSSDHKITDVKLVSGDEASFNNEVMRAIKGFQGTIIPSTGHPYYLSGVSFNIVANNGIKQAKAFDKSFSQSDKYTCITEINGFTKDDMKN